MATAVICEFNPFHNGHKYLLEQAKKLRNEPVIAVMSGSFTQRGEPAFCSKFERARTALENGADLVLELPTVYAVACAQRFAQGGVDIAKSFGEVNYLAFGCETDDIALLRAAADALGDPKVNGLIADKMKNGAYYPQAVERAVREVLGDGAGGALASPNNILAVEYLKAVRTLGLSLMLAGLFMCGFGLFENMVPICAFGFLFFAALPFANNCLDYLIRTNIPDEAQGRAWGLIGFLSQSGYVVAYTVSGAAADALGKISGRGVGRGAALVVIIAGLCLAATALLILVSKSIKALEYNQEA